MVAPYTKLITFERILIMNEKVIEVAIYEREHMSHNMFAQMDWDRDSIMREIDRPAVPMLESGK